MRTKITTNMTDSMASLIGTYRGVCEAAKDDRFIRELMLNATNSNLDKFNVRAARVAKTTRNLNNSSLSHMFEYGTAGITPGQVVFTDATSPAARLWLFKTVASGKQVSTFMTFRDATVPNPKPSQRTDLKNMDPRFISKMSNRKYVFKKRAELTERGATVRPFPYRAKALIFPSKENDHGAGFWHRSRGPAEINLGGEKSSGGAKHTNSFTTFFMTWWNTEGAKGINQSTHQSITSRIGVARKAMEKYGNKMTTPGKTDIAGQVKVYSEKSKSYMFKEVPISAAQRRRRGY